MPHPDLDDLARRPVRYWSVDGLPELMMGLLWIVWGGAWIVGQQVPHDWRWAAYWLLVPPLLATGGFVANWATRRLKERVTFPRSGYVEWKAPDLGTRIGAAAVVIAAALALALMVLTGDARPAGQMAAPIIAVILSLGFVVISVRQHAPHHLALGGLVLALGIALGWTHGGWTSVNWMFLGLGLALTLVGGLRLARFLRRHAPSPEDAR
jgi:hypothetical protein